MKKEIDLIKAENETLQKLVARMEKLESEINLMSELPPCETCEYEPSKKENSGEHIGNSHEPVSEKILFKLPPCETCEYEPSKKENLGEHIGNSHEPVSEEILFKCDF